MLKFNSSLVILFRVGRRNYATAQTNQSTRKEKWDIFSAVSLERRPIVSRDLNELEKRFSKLLQDIEFERSHKSSFEIRMEKDKKRAIEVKEGHINITDMDSFPQQTAQDFLDASLEELKSFKFSNRKHSEAIEKDLKSLKRALDRHLLLLITDKIGEKNQWVLPQGIHMSGETLRETAERTLKEKCGTQIQAKFLGNAPFGFYKYRYPTAVRSGESVGSKIFFFKAEVISGQPEISNSGCIDFMWATRNELDLLPHDYLKSIKMFLIDEEH